MEQETEEPTDAPTGGERLLQVGEHLLIAGGQALSDEDVRRLRLAMER